MTECKVGYNSPRWSGEISDCSLPMTFDTYSNCSFGCVYCFSQFQRGIGEGKEEYLAKKVKCVEVQKVKDIFLGKRESQFWPYIKERRTMQWGGAFRSVRRQRAGFRQDAGAAEVLQGDRLPVDVQHEEHVVAGRCEVHRPVQGPEELELQVFNHHKRRRYGEED